MNLIAVRVYVGDKAKHLGIIIGLTFAPPLITQQSAIFTRRAQSHIGARDRDDRQRATRDFV
jgi:hypothetical protein